MRYGSLPLLLLSCLPLTGRCLPDGEELRTQTVSLNWVNTREGWKLTRMGHTKTGREIPWGVADGSYSILYSKEKPSDTPLKITDQKGDSIVFVEQKMTHIKQKILQATSSVPMNRAGKEYRLYPRQAERSGDTLRFTAECPVGNLTARWWPDPLFPDDIRVSLRFIPSRDGYFSLSSPTPATLPEKDLQWGVVPGWFQGDRLQPRFRLAYLYGQGLPEYPVICRESTVTTPVSILSSCHGTTLAVIPDPGQDRDPYACDRNTHLSSWKIGLSHMNRTGGLCPTAYHPVLGEEGSQCRKGDTLSFDFRYTLSATEWFGVFSHAVYDIYDLRKMIGLKRSSFSLTDRLHALHDYAVNDTLSLWRTELCQGVEIGAQAYLGAVAGAQKDAMKNSDVGSVWMMARMTGDPLLTEKRLPYIRNFKRMQQEEDDDDFLSGAAKGQYYLSQSKRFVEEWGNHTEPIALTYYTMCDIGNILLFEPGDTLLRQRLRKGAERLLAWQHPDGSFAVAYDKRTRRPIYTDLADLRPTFYGLLVAYRIFGEEKFLAAARRGADWFIRHAVDRGSFLGVCGDARFINDFATGQSAQALLDLYDITGEPRYRDAAVRTARIYTCSIYTHPTVTRRPKRVKERLFEEWQISQVGLPFEHGGSAGSAVGNGPILLTSHCGMFVRMFAITGDSLFLDMARCGAIAREAHLNPESKTATYYWGQFDRGPGPFPMHGWWQTGWIADYLMAEAELRSAGGIRFPRGFFTPKVGPQQISGFAPAYIYGDHARWILRKGLLRIDNANVDALSLLAEDGESLYLILLNNSAHPQTVRVGTESIPEEWKDTPVILSRMDAPDKPAKQEGKVLYVTLEGFGIQVYRITRR